MCCEEVVVEMNMHAGDDDVEVQKSPTNEKPHEK
jgi:hypothetical protein